MFCFLYIPLQVNSSHKTGILLGKGPEGDLFHLVAVVNFFFKKIGVYWAESLAPLHIYYYMYNMYDPSNVLSDYLSKGTGCHEMKKIVKSFKKSMKLGGRTSNT